MRDRMIAFLAANWIRLIWNTKRDIRFVNDGAVRELVEAEQPFLMAMWHNRFFMGPFGALCDPSRSIPFTSLSRDGGYVVGTLKRLGHPGAIRGSSSRGGREAVRKGVNALKNGLVVGITPDGPRGPRYEVKAGTVMIARMAGVPVVPFSYNCSRKKVFDSWDRFIMPYPCSRFVFAYGDPILVTRADDPEEKRLELERSMKKVTQLADEWEF